VPGVVLGGGVRGGAGELIIRGVKMGWWCVVAGACCPGSVNFVSAWWGVGDGVAFDTGDRGALLCS